MSKKMKEYVSANGTYVIPVSWAVYSSIVVEADNLEEAVNKAKELADDLPLCSSELSEYVDGSYSIDVENDEDALNAQDYRLIGNVRINKDGSISS